ncbi:4-azaleucine resistance transporter AzlC [Saccharopolyspora lacisalsi]|uniref:4-azaleucine resistance transporter AzlC n=1 Tax=Halosaccharopolyspora lacisalsi TaxID=1000566 RepID=A0A839DR85_9PSEU|nr:AzlC family ABC transporter permease [Halosaccharopolyspora lacisalsi]MBA8823480.1 4-azaleucine resistance transporter AzlC [Halosaccharopolyspora lacisalsi]
MRSPERTLWRSSGPPLRDVLSVAVAMSLVGASLGAIAVSKGMSLWLVTAMSALVFAGGSEFMAVGLITGGAAPITAVLGGVMLNARHFPYGLAIGNSLATSRRARLFGSHVMVDEAVAFALAENDPAARRRAYWTVGLVLYGVWAPSVFLGGLLGRHVGDPATFGLDAALPAALLALIIPSLRERSTLRAVVVGAVLALATTPLLPEGMPVMVALVGVAAALPLPTGEERR